MSINITLSRRMGEVRWTQYRLVQATGIRAGTINSMYHNVAERVSLEHLDLICDALQCDLTDIMHFVPNRPSKVKFHVSLYELENCYPQQPQKDTLESFHDPSVENNQQVMEIMKLIPIESRESQIRIYGMLSDVLLSRSEQDYLNGINYGVHFVSEVLQLDKATREELYKMLILSDNENMKRTG